MVSQLTSADRLVTMVRVDDVPDNHFQVVTLTDGEATPRLVKAFPTQGDAVSWLLCNGYKWIAESNNPQQWVQE